jgi:hypothetical protein
LRLFGAAIDASRRQAFTMNRFFEDSSYLLREGAMFCSGASTKRLFQVIGYICSNENAFAISHLSSITPYLFFNFNPAKVEQVYKPNSVSRHSPGWRSFI